MTFEQQLIGPTALSYLCGIEITRRQISSLLTRFRNFWHAFRHCVLLYNVTAKWVHHISHTTHHVSQRLHVISTEMELQEGGQVGQGKKLRYASNKFRKGIRNDDPITSDIDTLRDS